MKRGSPLTRRTALRAAPAPAARTPLPRTATRTKPAAPKDWTAARGKVTAEGRCRVCGATEGLQAAHVLGQRHDRDGVVQANHVVPLCGPCHLGRDGYDLHALNLRPHLTDVEWAAAIDLVGEGPAERRVMGRAWREGT